MVRSDPRTSLSLMVKSKLEIGLSNPNKIHTTLIQKANQECHKMILSHWGKYLCNVQHLENQMILSKIIT